jgi:hypothetical protein
MLRAALLLFVICLFAMLVDIDPAPTHTEHSAAQDSRTEPPAARVASVETPRTEPTSEEACLQLLRKAGVGFQTIPEQQADGVAWPMKLTGPVDGIRVQGDLHEQEASYLDCKLALAILAWAPHLRAQGVVGLQHYSMYRADAVVAGGGKPSGHARGLALDVAVFELRDGRKLSVLDDWKLRTRGADPCASYTRDPERGAALRGIVCDAVERALFQTVITPHYNDAHANHVHLEIGPPDRTFVH